jgi:hypothetical protein
LLETLPQRDDQGQVFAAAFLLRRPLFQRFGLQDSGVAPGNARRLDRVPISPGTAMRSWASPRYSIVSDDDRPAGQANRNPSA